MNRTLKEATVITYYDQTPQHLKEHLHAFLMAYNFVKRLKTLRGLPLMHISVNAGKKIPNALPSIRTITPWDYTPNCRPSSPLL
jgi:hypothetical protein